MTGSNFGQEHFEGLQSDQPLSQNFNSQTSDPESSVHKYTCKKNMNQPGTARFGGNEPNPFFKTDVNIDNDPVNAVDA